MFKFLLSSAAVVLTMAASPTLAQNAPNPNERAQITRDWNEMSREWDARQRSGIVPPAGSERPVSPAPGAAMKVPDGPMPADRSGAAFQPSAPTTAAERAQAHRDWNEMSREWDARQRSGTAPQPYQR
jgi:hypothetical protein